MQRFQDSPTVTPTHSQGAKLRRKARQILGSQLLGSTEARQKPVSLETERKGGLVLHVSCVENPGRDRGQCRKSNGRAVPAPAECAAGKGSGAKTPK